MKMVLVSCVAWLFLAAGSAGATAGSKPNIVFIIADDLGWQDVGFMGSQWFETPVLDRVADESLVFSQAYMYPTCSPSRAAVLTGQQSFRTGVYNVPVLELGNASDNIFSRWTVGREHTLYARVLADAGYKLIHLGKWHIVGPHPEEEEREYPFHQALTQPPSGDMSWVEHHRSPGVQAYYPTGRGFDENIGGTWWGDPARGHEKGYHAEGGGYVSPFKNPFIADRVDGEWLTDRLTTEAIEFIERNKDRPFFVNLNYYAPHQPTVKRNQAWFDHFMQKPADPVTGQGHGRREEIAAYATMVKSIDENVGRIVDVLDKEGLRDSTIIIFTSDNGFNSSQSETSVLRGSKGTVYEGGLRVPALINWPNVVAPGRSATPITGMDYFPTFLELASVDDYRGQLDGQSLVPLLKREAGWRPRSLYWHIASRYKSPPASIVRDGDWKLIQYLLDGTVELYNLKDDLGERRDVSAEHPDVTKALVQELDTWRRENSVPLPPGSSLHKDVSWLHTMMTRIKDLYYSFRAGE
jgi:arylsulfatase A-like enzyme